MSESSVRAQVERQGWSLRTRIVLLAALIALLSTSICALTGTIALNRSLTAHARAAARETIEDSRHDLENLIADIAYQVNADAMSDELHAQLASPAPAWTWADLGPRRPEGTLVNAFVLVSDGRIVARSIPERTHARVAARSEPSEDAMFLRLAARGPGSGLTWVGSHPAIVGISPVLRKDRSEPSLGLLIGLAYLDDSQALSRISRPGWIVSITNASEMAEEPRFIERSGRLAVMLTLPRLDHGAMQVTVEKNDTADGRIGLEANDAIMLGGFASLVLATLIGGALGWHWLRPIERLAAACRIRVTDPTHPLPPVGDLTEASVLIRALDDYAAAERDHRDSLAQALDRQTTVNAVHQRFLAQMAHEIGDPIHRLVAVIARLSTNAGHLPPEEVAAARDDALALEERLNEVLGLAGEIRHPDAPLDERDLGGYLTDFAQLLRPLAERQGRTVAIEAAPGKAVIDTRLVSPVLVTLATNALRAGTSGPVRLLASVDANGGTRWEIIDTGPGIAQELAERIHDACARGEVLPGTPGIGLGLAVALANVRTLNGTLRLAETGPTGTRFVIELPPTPSRTPTGSSTARFARKLN